jgi:hypothetical protein
LYVGQRLDGAAGLLHRPPAGTAWQWVVGVRLEQFGLAEICCAPEYYVPEASPANEFGDGSGCAACIVVMLDSDNSRGELDS